MTEDITTQIAQLEKERGVALYRRNWTLADSLYAQIQALVEQQRQEQVIELVEEMEPLEEQCSSIQASMAFKTLKCQWEPTKAELEQMYVEDEVVEQDSMMDEEVLVC